VPFNPAAVAQQRTRRLRPATTHQYSTRLRVGEVLAAQLAYRAGVAGGTFLGCRILAFGYLPQETLRLRASGLRRPGSAVPTDSEPPLSASLGTELEHIRDGIALTAGAEAGHGGIPRAHQTDKTEVILRGTSANPTMLRAFSLIWLFGRLLSLTLLFTVFLPTMWRYIASPRRNCSRVRPLRCGPPATRLFTSRLF
jgi:hypothetical protein